MRHGSEHRAHCCLQIDSPSVGDKCPTRVALRFPQQAPGLSVIDELVVAGPPHQLAIIREAGIGSGEPSSHAVGQVEAGPFRGPDHGGTLPLQR